MPDLSSPIDPSARPTSAEPLECEAPPPQAAPPRVADSRQAFVRPAGDSVPVGDDSGLESRLRAEFSKLEPSDSLELSGTFEAKAEVSGELRGRVRVERAKDGGFDVLLEGQGEGGVGAPVVGHARIGVAGGTRFHVSNAGEAADLCDALIKGATVSAVPFGSVVADVASSLGAKDDLLDATARVRSYLPRIAEVRAEVVENLQVGGEAGIKLNGFGDLFSAKTKLKAETRAGLSFNVEKGELTVNQTFLFQAEASAHLNWLGKLGGGGRPAVTAQFVYKLDAETRRALEAGELTTKQALELVARELVPDRVVVRGEVEVSGKQRMMAEGADVKVRAKAEVSLEPAALRKDPTLDGLAAALGGTKWSIETDAGIGAGGQAALGVVSGEVNITRRHKWVVEGLSRKEVVKQLTQDDQSSLESLRATSNL